MSSDRPRFSVLTPVFDPPVEVLEACARSVHEQTGPTWEWVLVDDGSRDARVREVLVRLATDPRVTLLTREATGGIAVASQQGLHACTGELVALLDHDDELLPSALEVVDAYMPDGVDLAYSDEEIIAEDGEVLTVVSKPAWSPTRLRAHNYVNHLTVLRREAALAVGGFREGFDGSQDHDLLLRVTERARGVHHVPHVLYRWRGVPRSVLTQGLSAKPGAWENGRRAVQEHCDRIGLHDRVDALVVPGIATWYDVVPDPPRWPSVGLAASVGATSLAPGALEGWLGTWAGTLTGLPSTVVLAVADEHTPQVRARAQAALEGRGVTAAVVGVDPSTPRSVALQRAALSCDVEVLLLVSERARPGRTDLVRRLVGASLEPDIGLVGAQVRGPGDVVAHAGYALVGGGPRHLMAGLPAMTTAYTGAALVPGERSAVAVVAAAVRRDVFASVGGLSPRLHEAFVDVDLSLKLRRAGRRNLCLPSWVVLDPGAADVLPRVDDHPGALRLLRARWARELAEDPYVNPRVRRDGFVRGATATSVAG